MPAANLTAAAGETQIDLFTLWKAGTLQAKVVAFASAALLANFPDGTPTARPIADWLTVIAAFAPSILPYTQAASVGVDTSSAFQQVADYVYRVCKLGAALQTLNLITAGQAAALLAAYNANFT